MRGHLFVGFILLCGATLARADEARIAVAANFAHTLEQLRAPFEQHTGHRVQIISASTGKLFAQITHGAPFDVLLSADAETPARLVTSGVALAATQFTYARGRLVIWSGRPERIADARAALTTGSPRVAIANPMHAPFGRAAQQALRALQIWSAVEKNVVYGENVNQTMQFAASGNTDFALVALAQVLALPPMQRGAYWEVPRDAYAALTQDAVLLVHGRHNGAARDFLDFLRGSEARAIIRAAGYD